MLVIFPGIVGDAAPGLIDGETLSSGDADGERALIALGGEVGELRVDGVEVGLVGPVDDDELFVVKIGPEMVGG